MATWSKRILLLALVALVAFGFIWALRPTPVPVDLAEVERGPLSVTLTEEGQVEIRDVYRVAAPLGGRVARSPLEIGDEVVAQESLVATIHPADPPFLDRRSTRELEAAVAAARAAVSLREVEIEKAESERDLALAEYRRAQSLNRSRNLSDQELDRRRTELQTRRAGVLQAEAALALAASELASAEARLIQPGQMAIPGSDDDGCCVSVRSPVNGVVLAVPVESEQVVPVGTVLAEVGDPKNLEVVVDLLSEEALLVPARAEARLTDWGGAPLTAVVRQIDPVAFTKVSALGIEEQRVNLRLDLAEGSDGLGHGYRVYVEIEIWRDEDLVKLPLGALFRHKNAWAVFLVEGGTAVLRPVEIGRRNDQEAQVINGLAPDDQVVLYPSDRVVDGVAIVAREAGF